MIIKLVFALSYHCTWIILSINENLENWTHDDHIFLMPKQCLCFLESIWRIPIICWNTLRIQFISVIVLNVINIILDTSMTWLKIVKCWNHIFYELSTWMLAVTQKLQYLTFMTYANYLGIWVPCSYVFECMLLLAFIFLSYIYSTKGGNDKPTVELMMM